jgi:hypothetical protein
LPLGTSKVSQNATLRGRLAFWNVQPTGCGVVVVVLVVVLVDVVEIGGVDVVVPGAIVVVVPGVIVVVVVSSTVLVVLVEMVVVVLGGLGKGLLGILPPSHADANTSAQTARYLRFFMLFPSLVFISALFWHNVNKRDRPLPGTRTQNITFVE